MNSGFEKNLAEMIESHPSIIVGTCDKALVPCMSRAFGARILARLSSFEILVSRWPGPQTQANIEQTGRIAVTFSAPETFESYQFKGRATYEGECTKADIAFSEIYTQTICDRITALGEPREQVSTGFTAHGLYRVKVDVDSIYRQTPGKDAGRKL